MITNLPRGTNKAMWRYMHRLERCILRAQRESGSTARMMQDMMIYGTGFYRPAQDSKRIVELMRGLKP